MAKISPYDNNKVYNAGRLNNIDVVGDSKKIKPAKKSVFQLPIDKNKNFVIDYQDFDDAAEAKFFEEKGLIGKTWDYLKLHVGKLLGIKNATVNISQIGVNGEDQMYTMEVDNSGNVVSYYQDWGTGRAYTQKFVNDEYGNPKSAILYETRTRTGETKEVSQTTYSNEYDDNGNLVKRVTHESNGMNGGLGSSIETFYSDGRLASRIEEYRAESATPDIPKYDEQGRKIIYDSNDTGFGLKQDNSIYDITQANFKYDSGEIDIDHFKVTDNSDDLVQ